MWNYMSLYVYVLPSLMEVGASDMMGWSCSWRAWALLAEWKMVHVGELKVLIMFSIDQNSDVRWPVGVWGLIYSSHWASCSGNSTLSSLVFAFARIPCGFGYGLCLRMGNWKMFVLLESVGHPWSCPVTKFLLLLFSSFTLSEVLWMSNLCLCVCLEGRKKGGGWLGGIGSISYSGNVRPLGHQVLFPVGGSAALPKADQHLAWVLWCERWLSGSSHCHQLGFLPVHLTLISIDEALESRDPAISL